MNKQQWIAVGGYGRGSVYTAHKVPNAAIISAHCIHTAKVQDDHIKLTDDSFVLCVCFFFIIPNFTYINVRYQLYTQQVLGPLH